MKRSSKAAKSASRGSGGQGGRHGNSKRPSVSLTRAGGRRAAVRLQPASVELRTLRNCHTSPLAPLTPSMPSLLSKHRGAPAREIGEASVNMGGGQARGGGMAIPNGPQSPSRGLAADGSPSAASPHRSSFGPFGIAIPPPLACPPPMFMRRFLSLPTGAGSILPFFQFTPAPSTSSFHDPDREGCLRPPRPAHNAALCRNPPFLLDTPARPNLVRRTGAIQPGL
ncbi:hypothetical protein SAMN05421828_13617 [Acidiphilium rubrum]|uniref:Uncharacterized protein n=1 Tax=Acidiphilium rubrum TaxID=526 RepID=A0A8G2CNN0_ACIRU|nr:hypothetical protein SAMN05421828_13617 [Acidiphilium rubrum]